MRYWVAYHLPAKTVIGKDGQERTVYPQRREVCDRENPYSIELARAADGKRKTQRVENPSILERLPEETMTFKELSGWYLDRLAVRAKTEGLRDTRGPRVCLDNFNAVYGDRIVRTITVEDLQKYREKRKEEGRAIPMNRHVKEVLLSVPRAVHHDYVFTYHGNPIETAGGHKKAFMAACKDAGIPHGTKTENGVTFRDIRTTVKTNMLAAGVDKVYRDKILGHSLKGMDEYYMKPSEEDLHRAMDKYTAWIDDQFAFVDQTVDQVNKATNF